VEADRLRTVRAEWTGTLLVCRKCSKKLDGGFGPDGRLSLAKALKRYLSLGKGRKSRLGVVEVKCLGICPKNAVTVVDGAQPGDWKLVERATPIDEVVSALVLPHGD
jgi:predicted metal-binding protein